MPFQAVPDAALINVQGLLDGQQTVNTLGFRLNVPGVVNAAQLASLCESVAIYWAANQMGQLPEQWTLAKVTGRVLDVEDGPVAESTLNSGDPGGLVGNLMPNNVTLAIAFRTGLGGRTNRGRNYWPAFLEADVSNSAISFARASAIVATYEGMMGAGTVDSAWRWCVISRKIIDVSGAGRGVPITSVVVNDLVVDSQRRRLPGRGK